MLRELCKDFQLGENKIDNWDTNNQEEIKETEEECRMIPEMNQGSSKTLEWVDHEADTATMEVATVNIDAQ